MKWAGVAVVWALGGCYSGLSGPGGGGADDESATGSQQTTGEGSESSDTDGEPEDPDASDCEPGAFGPSATPRVTRDEYVRAVRDLLGVAVDPAPLAGDERLGPFAVNLNNALSAPGVRGYQAAAESAAGSAIAEIGVEALVPCEAGDTSDACAEAFVADFARRAYRRPPTEEEQERLLAVHAHGRASDGFAYGIELVIQVVLQSPNFLYRFDLGGQDGAATFDLTAYEIASRMSFLLWGTIPDEGLLDAAEAGTLLEPAKRRDIARQMLADDKAREGVGRIYAQLFGAAGVQEVSRDPALYPEFDGPLAAAMELEIAETAATLVLEEDAGLAELLTSGRSRVTPELAAFYGVEIDSGATPSPTGTFDVELPPSERAGLLTRAGVMARLSHEHITAPVKRANFVLHAIACVEVPDPPADVDDTPPAVDPTATGRELLEMKTAAASCQMCHSFLNAVGFGFEHYDPSGKFRTQDGENPVDATGMLLGLDVAGSFDGAVELSALLAQSGSVAACVADKHAMIGFARALDEEGSDECLLDELRAEVADGQAPLADLLVAIVGRASFGMRKVAAFAEGEG